MLVWSHTMDHKRKSYFYTNTEYMATNTWKTWDKSKNPMEPAGFRVFTKLTRAHYLRQQMQGPEWRGVAWLGCCARFLSTEQPCPMPGCFICYLDRKIYPRHIPGVSEGFDSPNSHCSTVGLWKMYGYKMIVIPAWLAFLKPVPRRSFPLRDVTFCLFLSRVFEPVIPR